MLNVEKDGLKWNITLSSFLASSPCPPLKGPGNEVSYQQTSSKAYGILHASNLQQSQVIPAYSPFPDFSMCIDFRITSPLTSILAVNVVYYAGIGKATVERLASEGANVAIFDINKAAGEQLVSDLTSKSQKASFLEVDVSSKEQCMRAVKTVAEANSDQIHSLVNCVAYFGSKGITAEKEDWDKSFSVNVVGYANMVQACYEYMKKMPGEKSIVHTASISGHRCQPTR